LLTTDEKDLLLRIIWSKTRIDLEYNKCWIWEGTNTGRYGVIVVDGKQRYVHRLIFEAINGPIPKGHIIRHLCHTPLCINPKHLATGTHKDNKQDSVKANRHAYGERSGMSRLNVNDVETIFDLWNGGVTQPEIAEFIGVSKSCVSHVIVGNTWRHLNLFRTKT